MIDEKITFKKFNYTSNTLKHGSNKRVWVICKMCGYGRSVRYVDYNVSGTKGLCHKCSNTGKHNGMFGKHHSDKSKRLMSDVHIGNKASNETKQLLSIINSGTNNNMYNVHMCGDEHWNYGNTELEEVTRKRSATLQGIPYNEWTHYASYIDYSPEFNFKLKEYIRNMYDRRCFLCNKSEIINTRRLDVHHVDSNKRNSNISNLIPLCMKCHRKLINNTRMESCITYIKQEEENGKDK